MSLPTDISLDLFLAIEDRDHAPKATTSICPTHCVCDWDLVTESHSSRGRVRNGCNDRFSKRNLTAVVTTHKGDPLLLLNPPPKSLSCGFPRRSVGKYDQVYRVRQENDPQEMD